MLTEFDKRILLDMLHDIFIFKKRELNLDTLFMINQSLEALLDSLTQMNTEWIEAFGAEWEKLELVTAITFDKEKSELSEDDKKTVLQAINNIEKMINDILHIEKK